MVERVLNSINKLKLKNTELGDYLERIANKIIDNYGNNPEQLEALLKDLERLLVHVQELLILKETINKDIEYIKKKPTGYDYVGMINLLNDRRNEINSFINDVNSNRREDEITNLVNETLEIFTNLQMCIISTYVMQKKLVDEINQGKNTITNLWDDNFIDFVIINNDEIARLKYCISNLYIEGTFQKERLEYLLTFESDNIRRSIELWTIVAENMGIMKTQTQDKTRGALKTDSSIQIDNNYQEETLNYYDLEKGDITKLIRNIPVSEKIRLEKEWLKLKGYEDAFNIPDNVICIPDEKEIGSILVDIIDTKERKTRYWDDCTMTFLGRDGIQNVLELNGGSDSIKIIKEHTSTIMDFDKEKNKKVIFFMKEIDTIFPELYLLSDCMDELIEGKKNLWNKLTIRGDHRKNPKKYSKIFELCNNNIIKLRTLTGLPEMQVDLDKLLKSRKEYYQKYGIDISKKDKEEKKTKDKASEKTLYQKMKKTYSFGKAIDFLYSIKKAGLGKIEFPEEKRKKIEKILCELEGIQVLEDTIYTPTNEELFMTIEAIIEKKCSEGRLTPIKFIDKDGIPSYFEGLESTCPDEGFVSENAHLKYTLNQIEREIKILHKRYKWFDNKSICLLWLLDLLFETNCLTEYINDLINNESETKVYTESYIYNSVHDVYDSFKEITKSGKNYQRHKMRWEYNRRKHYSLEEKVSSNAETEGTKIGSDVIRSDE